MEISVVQCTSMEKSGPVRFVSIGSLMIATVLANKGHQVSYREIILSEQEVLSGPIEQAIYLRLKDTADVVAIGCMVNTLPFVLLAVENLKKEYPEKTVILGGPGPSIVADEIVSAFDAVDFVCVGEGELTVVEFMAVAESGVLDKMDYAKIPGLVFKSGGRIIKTEPRQMIADLDTLPVPDYSFVPDFDQRNFHLLTSRGCLYNCGYCTSKVMWGRSFRSRSLDHIISELSLGISAENNRRVSIIDDLFLGDEKIVSGLLEYIAGVGSPWGCNTRPELLTDQYLDLFQATGCENVYIGIESGSDRVLAKAGKRLTIDVALSAVAKTVKRGIKVYASFIWGYPFETLDDLHETALAIATCKSYGVNTQLHLLAPVPQSPVYEKYRTTIRFDPELISDIVMVSPIPRIETYKKRFEHCPVIMVPFHYFDGPDMAEKKSLVYDLNGS